MSNPNHIVIVEDEVVLADILQKYLLNAGYESKHITDGSHAVETILQMDPALVILDLMLPGKDGLTICRELRAKSNVPIIMETAKVEEIDRLLGLGIGADDYICKPFSPRELVARVQAVLRRTQIMNQQALPASDQRLIVDEARWCVTMDGKDLGLTRREFQLLHVLHKRPGQVYSRSQLLDLVFPDDEEMNDRTIDSHIRNIRSKAKKTLPGWDPIHSVYGVGYSYKELD